MKWHTGGDYHRISTGDDSGQEKSDVERSISPSVESSSSLLEHSSLNRSSRSVSRKQWLLVSANILLFLTSVLLFIALPYRKPSELNWALKQVSSYSPILDQVEIPLVKKRVEGHLFPVEPQNLGRLPPGPETDAKWLDYEVQRPFALTREQVIALGKDPEKTVKLPDEDFGLGDDMYLGGMDVFHVLHCFNSIRQEAFKDYYFDGEKYHYEAYGKESQPRRTHNELWWLHLRHCTDIITQYIMCNSDATMTTLTWLETQERPWPDFSVDRQCRSFEALVKWRDENALSIEKAGLIKKPYDQTKIDPKYYELFGNETVDQNRHHPLWD